MADHAYMAFLDILGYRELLDADVRAGTYYFRDRMVRAFRVFESVNATEFHYKAISDSIYISCGDRDAAPQLLSLLSNVFVAFLKEQLLIRGGVSFGQHFENQSITYSPVLTTAYTLESKVAEFPRIVVDANIVEMFPEFVPGRLVLRSGVNWFVCPATRETFADVWEAAKGAHRANADGIRKSDHVRMKYRWLQDMLLELAPCLEMPAPAPFVTVIDESSLPVRDPDAG